jgi:acetyl-CoA C-acetyltransferase
MMGAPTNVNRETPAMASTSTKNPDDLIPVIVGAGEIADRPADPARGLEPLALMVEALKHAEQDAGAKLLHEIDSIDVVNLTSWRYNDPAQQLCSRLGIKPARAVYGPVGGEGPIRYLHEAALRIARGESRVAAVCSAEAQSTVNKAEKAGIKLPWTKFADDAAAPVRGASYQHPMSVALNVSRPITVYPFYDAASAAHWGQTPREALRESGELWARYAEVATHNPNAWIKRKLDAADITTPTADNRLIAWPYTKLMVANPTVNQGAALLLTSLARARAAGIPDDRMIHVWGGAWADEPRDYLDRDQYHESHAQNEVLETVMAMVDGGGRAFDAIELYSCFPCVPKMARRTLGLGADVQPTVTGGLTFFGAPLSCYMAHAACGMVRRLRGGAQHGLLYGQGGYVTKHHALVLSPHAAKQPLAQDTSVQDKADKRRGAVPEVVTEASGNGTAESFTVIYGRQGEVEHGVVMLRTAEGKRTLARVPASDGATIARLTDPDRTPIGLSGAISKAGDGLLQWTLAS